MAVEAKMFDLDKKHFLVLFSLGVCSLLLMIATFAVVFYVLRNRNKYLRRLRYFNSFTKTRLNQYEKIDTIELGVP